MECDGTPNAPLPREPPILLQPGRYKQPQPLAARATQRSRFGRHERNSSATPSGLSPDPADEAGCTAYNTPMQDSHDPSSASTDPASHATDPSAAAFSSADAPDAAAGRGLAEPPLAVQRGFRWTMGLIAALGCCAGAVQAVAAGTPWPFVGLACAFWAILIAGLAKYARLPRTADEHALVDPSAP